MSIALPLEVAKNATATAAATTTTTATSSSSTFAAVPLAPSAANSTGLSGIIPAIQNFANSFASNAALVTFTLDNAVLNIAKASVVLLVILGVLLYFTRVNKHLGKQLLEGGIVIGLFVEFVAPFLMSLHF